MSSKTRTSNIMLTLLLSHCWLTLSLWLPVLKVFLGIWFGALLRVDQDNISGFYINSRPARYTYWGAHNVASVGSSPFWITVIEWKRTVTEKCTTSAEPPGPNVESRDITVQPDPPYLQHLSQLMFRFGIRILECRLRPMSVCNLDVCA